MSFFWSCEISIGLIAAQLDTSSKSAEEIEKKPFILMQHGELSRLTDEELFAKREELLIKARRSLVDTDVLDIEAEHGVGGGMVDGRDSADTEA